MIIFADRQTCNQTDTNSKTEATFYPLWSVDSRGAGQQAENSITEAHSNPLWSVDSRGAGQLSIIYQRVL